MNIDKILQTPRKMAFRIVKGVVQASKSTPMSVDVSAEGMKKKNLPKGTGVTYSGVRTSSQGLLTGANTEKKTLLGG
jgi:hypothetical protein